MTEEEKKSELGAMSWRFWFSVTLSLLLIVTFVYYLPLRFFSKSTMSGMPMKGQNAAGGHKGHGGALLHEETDIKEGLVVNSNVAPMPAFAGNPAQLSFFVNEKPGNVAVPTDKLELEHTKLMHIIGVRDDMNEFFHIHPQPTSSIGVLTTPHVFAKPGRYKIWSQVTKDGVTHTFGHPPLTVMGAGEPAKKEVSFVRNALVGSYQVSLKTDEPFVKGKSQELSFDIHTSAGQEVEVDPYLGADMHLVLIKDDWTQFIHAHPEGMNNMHTGTMLFNEVYAHGTEEESGAGADKTINFHVVLPEAGLYRAYAQFRPKGTDLAPDEALTAMFWFKVEEKTPFPISPWWMLLFASAVLIILLGAGVKKYLKVKKLAMHE